MNQEDMTVAANDEPRPHERLPEPVRGLFAELESGDLSFVDLKATLVHFAHQFFSPTTKVRFRPSFFPFTEPSAEMDVECQICHGSGCPACKGTGWMEILGCGMVHPAVFEHCGVDPERYTGWAFGMGPHRITMLRYGIPDIRLLYEGDMRFLEQFLPGGQRSLPRATARGSTGAGGPGA